MLMTLWLQKATDAGAAQLKANTELQQSLGAKVDLIDGGAAFAEHFPWCNGDGIASGTVGASYSNLYYCETATCTVLRCCLLALQTSSEYDTAWRVLEVVPCAMQSRSFD